MDKRLSIHYEPLFFPPSDIAKYVNCCAVVNIPVLLSKHIESPFKGLGLRHGFEQR